jgi:hypothetical protein
MDTKKALNEAEQLARSRRVSDLARFEDIFHRVDQFPGLDSRTPDEIIDYDEPGLPR